MVTLKTKTDLLHLQAAGRLTAQALQAGGAAVRPGVTTADIDRVIHDFIVRHGGTPSFLHYGGFPATACISVNEEVIHGIPGNRVLKEGDIVSIDVGAKVGGFHGDSAYTFACGKISPAAQKLLDATRQSLQLGIAAAQPGNRIGDISAAVQGYCEGFGYSIVRDYVGHGVGRELHEEPEVPNFGRAGHGLRLIPGMVIAIEPMVNEGTFGVRVLDNDWTVVTMDGRLSAHFEHTVAITNDGPVILTTV